MTDLKSLADRTRAAAERIVYRLKKGAAISGSKAFGRELTRAATALERADARLARERQRR